MFTRREFLGLVGAVTSAGPALRRGAQLSEWGSPMFDLHCVARETLTVLKRATVRSSSGRSYGAMRARY